jgi:hypothetical protein
MFVIIDAHLQVSKVLAFTLSYLDLRVALLLSFLFLVESFIKEFILVIDDEVVGAVGEGHD